MTRPVHAAIGALALTLAAALDSPTGASAAAVDHHYDIATRMVEEAPAVGEFDGLLQLQVSAAGIVSGYYRPNDNGRFVPVTGGMTGQHFWLDIGSFSANPWHFSGTFSHGSIDAVSSTPIIDDGRFTGLKLIGTPKSTHS